MNHIITAVSAYSFRIEQQCDFSYGTSYHRYHAFIKIESEGSIGWSELHLSDVQNNSEFKTQLRCFEIFKGKTIEQAYAIVRDFFGKWPYAFTEAIDFALIDLQGKLEKKTAHQILGLLGKTPVKGVYVILSRDLTVVEEKIKIAIKQSLTKFIKIKLYGENKLDCAIISLVRKYLPKEKTYLIGDVNTGYSKTCNSIEDIAENLARLYKAGLDACEDPATMNHSDWVQLQTMVKPLSLIPDYILRPSSLATKTLIAGMGDIYNIHPACTGSLFDAILLAKKIKSIGAKLMIGDASLIGCACHQWQAVAIGLGANWVEATEKLDVSNFYYDSIKNSCIIATPLGYELDESKYGFGTEFDEKKLKSYAKTYVQL